MPKTGVHLQLGPTTPSICSWGPPRHHLPPSLLLFLPLLAATPHCPLLLGQGDPVAALDATPRGLHHPLQLHPLDPRELLSHGRQVRGQADLFSSPHSPERAGHLPRRVALEQAPVQRAVEGHLLCLLGLGEGDLAREADVEAREPLDQLHSLHARREPRAPQVDPPLRGRQEPAQGVPHLHHHLRAPGRPHHDRFLPLRRSARQRFERHPLPRLGRLPHVFPVRGIHSQAGVREV
mmetsp:Transcript_54394/g.172814  ORF Transcript_54394/g.172814 Transcript_54394/m.172814 type:complete len:236 (+) Transcript_54394:196-903(+)